MNNLTKETFLAHYGVQGMHWGIRRYQPYGEGGYDPKHKGEYTGKKSAKEAVRELRKVGKLGRKDKQYRIHVYANARKTNVAKKYLESDDYKKELKKYDKLRRERYKLGSQVERLEELESMDAISASGRKKLESLTKTLSKAISESDAQYNVLKSMGHDYAESVLGKYGNKKIRHQHGDMTAKELLYKSLNPIHEYYQL